MAKLRRIFWRWRDFYIPYCIVPVCCRIRYLIRPSGPVIMQPRLFSYPYGAMIFIASIPIGFQIANQKTRRRSKHLRALTGRVANDSAPLPFIKSFQMRPLLAWSISLTVPLRSHETVEIEVLLNYLLVDAIIWSGICTNNYRSRSWMSKTYGSYLLQSYFLVSCFLGLF